MIVADDPKIIENIEEFRNYIEKELNVKTINFTKNKSRYVKLRAEPDHKTLGSRLKSDFKRVTAAIRVRAFIHIYKIYTYAYTHTKIHLIQFIYLGINK